MRYLTLEILTGKTYLLQLQCSSYVVNDTYVLKKQFPTVQLRYKRAMHIRFFHTYFV